MVFEKLTFAGLKTENLLGKCGIYKIYNDAHIYIGSSKNLYNRLSEHRTDLKLERHSNSFLQNVYNKTGVDNMLIDIIEYCEEQIRTEREAFWIKELNADMNFQDPLTHELSEASKEKLRISMQKAREEGRWKTKYHTCGFEFYNIFGEFLTSFDDREEAIAYSGLTIQQLSTLASEYKKGRNLKGFRVRYSDSKVPVQKFEVNPQYIGRWYDFYVEKENGERELAFTSVKDVWNFLGKAVLGDRMDKITIIPVLKSCESGNPSKNEETLIQATQ
jgi:group I intron endonuclease